MTDLEFQYKYISKRLQALLAKEHNTMWSEATPSKYKLDIWLSLEEGEEKIPKDIQEALIRLNREYFKNLGLIVDYCISKSIGERGERGGVIRDVVQRV